MGSGPDGRRESQSLPGSQNIDNEFAKEVNLGSTVSWNIVAEGPGCVTMAFSVWNDAFTEPIDHVLVTFPVIKQGQTPLKTAGAALNRKECKPVWTHC